MHINETAISWRKQKGMEEETGETRARLLGKSLLWSLFDQIPCLNLPMSSVAWHRSSLFLLHVLNGNFLFDKKFLAFPNAYFSMATLSDGLLTRPILFCNIPQVFGLTNWFLLTILLGTRSLCYYAFYFPYRLLQQSWPTLDIFPPNLRRTQSHQVIHVLSSNASPCCCSTITSPYGGNNSGDNTHSVSLSFSYVWCAFLTIHSYHWFCAPSMLMLAPVSSIELNTVRSCSLASDGKASRSRRRRLVRRLESHRSLEGASSETFICK